MADNNENNYIEDEADEDLLTTIRRWTEKAQRENEAKRTQWPQQDPNSRHISSNPPSGNPWAPDLNDAADRVLREDPHSSPPPPRAVPPQRPMYTAPPFQPQPRPTQNGVTQNSVTQESAKKKRPVRRVLAILLVAVLLLGGGGYVLAFAMAGKVDSQPISREDRTELRAAKGSARVTNILIMGLDEEDGGRSDSMMLLSIDRVHRKLKLTSILRDCWVKLPNGKSNRINTAVFFGGPAMAMRTVSETFNVRVDHYVMFDFDVFEGIVDALGGISVRIENNEIDFLCKKTRLGKQIGKEEMKSQMEKNGKIKLTGEQALIFCRIRKLDTDFNRAERQRRFLESLLSACKKNPLRLLGLLGGDTLSQVKTDMTRFQMSNLAATAPLLTFYEFGKDTMRTVPFKGTYKDVTKKGMWIITLDVPENARRLREFIYE